MFFGYSENKGCGEQKGLFLLAQAWRRCVRKALSQEVGGSLSACTMSACFVDAHGYRSALEHCRLVGYEELRLIIYGRACIEWPRLGQFVYWYFACWDCVQQSHCMDIRLHSLFLGVCGAGTE